LPVAWTVTKASMADITEAPKFFAQLQSKHPLFHPLVKRDTCDLPLIG
jgi:hypothetical protein